MNRFFFSLQATIKIGILLAASFGYSLVPTAQSDSSDTTWQLTVTGLVDHPLNLTLADLFAMPQTTIYARLICVGPPSFLVTEGNWTGVRLWLILQEAGILKGPIKIAFHAKDNYTTDLTIDTAQRNDVILAYEKDGTPLSEKLRLVVPESWGYKWISQIINIELVDYNFLGTWESQGYPDNGTDTEQSGPDNGIDIKQAGFLPIEFIYAIVAAIFIVIIVVALIVIKKHQRKFTLSARPNLKFKLTNGIAQASK